MFLTNIWHSSDKLLGGQADELREFSRLRYEMSHGVGEVRVVTSQQADMFDCRTVSSPNLLVLTFRVHYHIVEFHQHTELPHYSGS